MSKAFAVVDAVVLYWHSLPSLACAPPAVNLHLSMQMSWCAAQNGRPVGPMQHSAPGVLQGKALAEGDGEGSADSFLSSRKSGGGGDGDRLGGGRPG